MGSINFRLPPTGLLGQLHTENPLFHDHMRRKRYIKSLQLGVSLFWPSKFMVDRQLVLSAKRHKPTYLRLGYWYHRILAY